MDLSGISSLTGSQSLENQIQNNSSQDDSSNASGWRYVTIQEGNKICTYIMIGKNMKILVGETAAKDKDDDPQKAAKDRQQTEKTADQSKSTEQATATNQAKSKTKKAEEVVPFLADTRMLGLTALHQQRMWEIMANLGNQTDTDKVAKTSESDTNSTLK
ncbi:MAG: hypothetical protein E6713_02300 [Sporomusaceae bacterium]|nr:hypothetical protein [Sporomusaceae bacterium]